MQQNASPTRWPITATASTAPFWNRNPTAYHPDDDQDRHQNPAVSATEPFLERAIGMDRSRSITPSSALRQRYRGAEGRERRGLRDDPRQQELT
jgi:hypothetical protein